MFQRFALVETLTDCDYNVVAAEDGVEALKELYNKKNHFDLVLLDLNMPKMNGYQVLQQINQDKKDKKWTDIPIVILSADDSKESVSRCLCKSLSKQ